MNAESSQSLSIGCLARKSKAKKLPLKKKAKTEPANSYGQFLKLRKQQTTEKDPKGRLDITEAQNEWKAMKSEEKAFYTDCYRKDKEEMGTNYRMKRKRKVKDNPVKKQKSKKVKLIDSKENPTVEFLEKLELVDINVEELRFENKVLCEEFSNEKVINGVNKYKLKIKTEELDNLKDKYEQLVLQHSLCKSK